ncbi:mannose-1-phosphate guanylyltransferase [Nocardioides marmotae]|uniref:NTP transferase domain-containing protein n=1 Tax=Nocardioides marmotae TaxID=2663857 RepID=A0A6I3J8R9_9ACTN|nr:mannose-1-phosphate guanylyltransferase [Nocardioides marmotae]MCR6031430.1 NTP transferase domain-containing protein [Gordonia jinghuaiqii]MBC9735437.1 mannose-1-phosphate guanylyltransferase [Nocardioides marmotae]MTB86534.1 NTP transferase domain-containing protein [Nocardioides marmotae]MTB95069.1 NTP transferase domain-containing protein [Nocardioides marmotae]QKE02435.1 mannose-1-phosphate guanylyltransferase [Nocardioides marmotae]
MSLPAPTDPSALEGFWAVIPAGGAGTRLWPLSRRTSPKFLRDLTGSGRSLLQETHERLAPLAEDRFLVVTGRPHRDAVAEQLAGLGDDAILAEPSARDSMAAIGLAAALLERRDPDAVMGSFAADHVIADPEAFRACVRTAVEVAREGWLVTLGIEPTFASSAFGYIHLGEELPGHPGVATVQEFVEKPSTDVAAAYLATGRYRWNAGMFVVRPTVLLDLLGTWHPEFAAALRSIAAEPDRLDELWPDLPKIALDHAVAEPAADAGRVVTVPSTFGWDDIGDFDSLATLLDALRDEGGSVTVLGDDALVRAVDSTGLVVPRSERVVAVVGLEDVVVVDTPDALLVTTRARAQEVKAVVAGLTESGRTDLT